MILYFSLSNFTVSIPFNLSIFQSIKAISNLSFCSISIASSPVFATFTFNPNDFSRCFKISCQLMVSSTTNAFLSLNIVIFLSCCCFLTSSISNIKLLPLPYSLSTHIFPFISSTNFLDITRPSPVPPYFLVVLPSACENDLKSLACCSLVSPIPVSFTSNLTLLFDISLIFM